MIVELRCRFEADNNHGVDYTVGKPQRKIDGEWVTLVDAPLYWQEIVMNDLAKTYVDSYEYEESDDPLMDYGMLYITFSV